MTNPVRSSVGLFFLVLLIGNPSFAQSKSTVPSGPYLGQKPPGSKPQIFASGIVNTENHREIEGLFGGNMQTFYFIRRPGKDQNHGLRVIKYKNHQWVESVVLDDASEPSISPDGKTIFLKTRYMERTESGWSAPKSLGAPFDKIDIMRLSASANGTYYFDTFTPELDTPLRYSRLVDGRYEEPKSLGPQFGVGTYNAHPYIAPDESFIVFDSRRENGYGSSDLYISFRAADGTWGPAINLGADINTDAAENYPSVSPDGQFLFFDRRVGERVNGEKQVDIYWVDTKIFETLRPK